MREYTIDRTWLVTFDSPSATLIDASVADDGTTALPLKGSIYLGTMQINGSIERSQDDPSVFIIQTHATSNYLTTQMKPAGTGVVWDIHCSSTGVQYNEPIDVDLSSSPVEIRIPTGEPVQPPLEREYWDEEFTITYKTDALNMTNLAAARGCVNTNSVTMTVRGQSRTFAPGTLKLSRGVWSDYWENGSLYFNVEIAIQYRADTWITKIQPMSYNIKNSGGTLIRIGSPQDAVTGQKIPACSPQYLTSDGMNVVATGSALPAPLSFWRYKQISFATILSGLTTVQ